MSGVHVAAQDASPAAAPQVRLHIDSQPLPQALTALATQTGVQLVYHPEDISAGVISPQVSGSYTPDKALSKILDSSGLSFYHVNSNTIAIRLARADKPAPRESLVDERDAAGISASNEAGNVTSSDARNTAPDSEETAGGGGKRPSAEVIVTAQKREERLQDVPVPVTAISADSMVEGNQLRMQDYYSSVPGLSMTSQGNGDVTLAIRGITTGYATNPSVGITIDDVPYGSSSVLTNGSLYLPDIDPSDLARIEVLRGPQGTLYGASSIGGLLKFVTADPSTQSLSGQVQADLNGVHNGDGAGYGVRGSVNVPVTDTLAFRASAFTRRDPGYVDNPTFGLTGVNRTDVSGGHFAALWRPSTDLSVKLSALIQSTDADGNSDVLLGAGDLQQATLPNSGKFSLRVQLYSANVTAKVGDINITSVTGYGINKADVRGDSSATYGGPGGYADIFGVTGAVGATDTETRKLSQEIRLDSSIGPMFDWLVGGFYTHESSPTQQPIYAADGVTGAPVGVLANFDFPSTFTETAVFADLTLHFTNQFDVQVGGRGSWNRQVYNETDTGPLIPAFFGTTSDVLVYPTERSTDHAVTYLLTPEFKFSPDLMTYIRLASGYRPGAPNADAILFGFPAHYAADKTYNYELGVKGDALDKKLSFDASVYYIDWKDIQISLFSPTGFVFYENAGSARSEGVELSGQARPVSGLTLAAWIAWNEAILTSNFPDSYTVGASGDRLPYSSRWSGNFSANEEFPLTTRMSGFVGAAVSYVGDRESAFNSVFSPPGPRPVFPAYAKTDLKAGLHYETWTFSAFLTNATDRRGVLSNVPSLTNYVNYIQPRTAGLSIIKTF